MVSQRLMNFKFAMFVHLRLFILCCVGVVCLGNWVEARETYQQFAARMVAQAVAENAIRSDLEDQLFLLSNSYRQSQGYAPLARDKTQLAAARAHAMDMLLNNFMGHRASTGQEFDSRMKALNGNPLILPRMAENAARVSKPGVVNAAMASSLFQQWVHSPGHRSTLVSRDYVSVAIGVVSLGGKLYADQIFVGPRVVTNMNASTPAEPPSLY